MNVDVLRDLVTTLLPYVAQTQPPTTPVFNTPTVPKRRRWRSQRWNSRCVRTPPAQLQVTVAASLTVTTVQTHSLPTPTVVSPSPAKQARYDHRPCHICGATPADLRTHVEKVHLSWNIRPEAACWLCERPLGQCLHVHMHGHSPQERRQAEFVPHFGSCANSMVAVLEAVRKLLK